MFFLKVETKMKLFKKLIFLVVVNLTYDIFFIILKKLYPKKIQLLI